jgi:cytochrome c peroxidase
VHPDRFGSRNTPSAMYMAYSPVFHFDAKEGHYLGGQFWDGRATTLEEQANAPFLNLVEMANPDQRAVVAKVRRAPYAAQFDGIHGKNALGEVEPAYERIAAYERGAEFRPFTSKYDAWLAGKARLGEQELRGLKLCEDAKKGNCAACHPGQRGANGEPPLFTDFTYDNLGVPRHPENPFYTQSKAYNPAASRFVDRGLGGAVAFYNDRDARPSCVAAATEAEALQRGCWPAAEVAANVNKEELGRLGLTEREVDDIVAFMETLADGYMTEK